VRVTEDEVFVGSVLARRGRPHIVLAL